MKKRVKYSVEDPAANSLIEVDLARLRCRTDLDEKA